MNKLIAILSLIATSAIAAPEQRTVQTYTNAVLAQPTNFWVANSNGINDVIRRDTNSIVQDVLSIVTNLFASSTSFGVTNRGAAILSGFTLTPSANLTNFWWDFGRTNANGERLIYATLGATTNVNFVGITNCNQWSILSFNLVASGSDVFVTFPSEVLPHFDSSYIANFDLGRFGFWLTNGNEFRMTLQSNSTLSTLCATFGQ